jgi:hemolysin activation/secretion protein
LPAVQEGLTPKVRAFDTAVQLANESPAKQLAVTLEEGQKRGDVDVRVAVIEGPIQRFSVLADNTGNAQTGRTRLTAGYRNGVLSERDDQISALVQISPEKVDAVRVFSLGYKLPLYEQGLMLQAYTSYSNVVSATAVTAAGDLNFSGQGRVFGLEVTRFIERAGEFEQRLSLALDKRDYLNNCAIQGLPEGACGSAGASVSVHPLTLGYQNLRKGGRPAGVSLAFSSNLALGGRNASAADFEAVRAGASRNFQMLRASAFLSLPVGADWQLNFRAIGQATSSKLVPGEQFGLTSVGVVRGYEEREVTGDSGLAGSFEVLMPTLMSAPPGQGATGFHDLRLLVFGDAGVTRNRGGLTCDGLKTNCQLSSVGLGARFAFEQSIWRFDLARANENARLTASGDLRVHFSASYAFP